MIQNTEYTGRLGLQTENAGLVSAWLNNYSAEVTTPDKSAIDFAGSAMRAGAPVFIASLPKDNSDKQLQVAIRLKDNGLTPIPHIVARNIPDEASFAAAVDSFSRLAGVNQALILGGDRPDKMGRYEAAVQLIRSGILEANGITSIAIAAYPEGHPRISEGVLEASMLEKLEAAYRAGLRVRLITQLCFDAETISIFAESLRNRGITEDLIVGVAGPTKPLTLLKYAAICGVGPSVRALRDRIGVTSSLIGSVDPTPIVSELAIKVAQNPSLRISGLHFFTFAALRKTIEWVQDFDGQSIAGCGA